MKRGRRRAGAFGTPRSPLVTSLIPLLVSSAAAAARVSAAPPARGLEAHAAFMPSPSLFGRLQQGGRRRSLGGGIVRAMQPRDGGESSQDSGRGGVAVHDDSWYLGDGGFAERHLDDEERAAAKQDEREFFRRRSLSVYDQMKEASMLLLAQQQILAAEETREEATKPRFVAAAGGSMAARAQAARDRQKRRDAVAGLLPDAPVAPAAGGGSPGSSSAASGEAAGGGGAANPVVVPVGPGMLSGDSLGVGGLDEELEEIRRRVCVPLAAPADLLEDLGISPVRGMLLHGPPGCGKTLLARRLSAALTPRPPAVVSGPEILERFVGSSEANIRALFDYPPDVPGGDEAEQAGALHVIVMDEFDSIGQRRGGGDDGGDRVRDSVVNQLLARMDGFQELERPTLLVALTNRIDLLDTALLRPGRFEVQVHIPGPDEAGREAILRIHTQRMHQAGRIDTPPPDAAKQSGDGGVGDGAKDGYDALVSSLAAVTDGFTGAELAGLVRAAASYALERAVGDVGDGGDGGGDASEAEGCRVTAEDFGRGLADVTRSKSMAVPPSSSSLPFGTRESAASQTLATAAAAASTAAAEAAAAKGENAEGAIGGIGDSGASFATAAAAVAAAAAAAEAERRREEEQVGVPAATATATPGVAAEAKPSVSAAAVAAARLEDGGLGGSLSTTDLESVQKLILQKTNQREDEDALLFDAAKVVAQRRQGGVRGGGGAGLSPGSGGARVPAAAASADGQQEERRREEEDEEEKGGDVESSANRRPRVPVNSRMVAFESEEDRCMYAFGVSLAIDADQFRKLLTVEERKTCLEGFRDVWLGTGAKLDHRLYADQVNDVLQARNKQWEERMAEETEWFLAEAAKAEGAVRTQSGMVIQTLVEGTGAAPGPNATVEVHYHGTLIDGSVFDSSVTRGYPAVFTMDAVIDGWAEGLQSMKMGGKSRLTIPPELAYGDEGSGPIPAHATLVFEVELLDFEG